MGDATSGQTNSTEISIVTLSTSVSCLHFTLLSDHDLSARATGIRDDRNESHCYEILFGNRHGMRADLVPGGKAIPRNERST